METCWLSSAGSGLLDCRFYGLSPFGSDKTLLYRLLDYFALLRIQDSKIIPDELSDKDLFMLNSQRGVPLVLPRYTAKKALQLWLDLCSASLPHLQPEIILASRLMHCYNLLPISRNYEAALKKNANSKRRKTFIHK
jgi:hypothetical protein